MKADEAIVIEIHREWRMRRSVALCLLGLLAGTTYAEQWFRGAASKPSLSCKSAVSN
jgi:hypothetical protein